MDVVFFRHGDALDIGQKGIERDHDRPLSPKGKKQVRRASEGLSRLWPGQTQIWTSPLVRARETADVIAEVLDEGEPHVTACLAPGGPFPDLGALMHGPRHIVVGHQPDLGLWAAWLLAGTTTRVRLTVSKSSAILIEAARLEPGAGTLVWSIPHKAFGED